MLAGVLASAIYEKLQEALVQKGEQEWKK